MLQDPYCFTGTRDYLPGDSPKLINWKASARLQKIQVNHYLAAASPKVAYFLHIGSSGLNGYCESADLLELSVITAASLCNQAINEGSEVMLAGNFRVITEKMDTDLTTQLPFGRGNQHLKMMLEALARLHPYGVSGAEQMIGRILPQIPRESRLVLITPHFNDRLAKTLEKAKLYGIHPVVVLVGNRYLNRPALSGIETYRVPGEENWREMDALRLV